MQCVPHGKGYGWRADEQWKGHRGHISFTTPSPVVHEPLQLPPPAAQPFLLDHLRVNCSEGLLRLVTRKNPSAPLPDLSRLKRALCERGAVEECVLRRRPGIKVERDAREGRWRSAESVEEDKRQVDGKRVTARCVNRCMHVWRAVGAVGARTLDERTTHTRAR